MKLIRYSILLVFVFSITTHFKMKNTFASKDIYTLGIWTVKPGHEQEFIRTWTEFANWTDKNISGPGKAYLLQDEKNPLRFISFGPWDHEKSIQGWRESVEFKNFSAKIRDLCDDFQPNTLKVVSTSK
jgi:heme-degrading monooxygenase HmoA